MKRLLLALTLLPTLAYAETPSEPKGAEFVRSYLQCEKTKENTQGKQMSEMACEERVSVRFCDIYSELSPDVQESIALEVYCNFLMGGQTGNERHDGDLADTAAAAGCFQGADARRTLLGKYKKRPEQYDALQNFSKSLLENETRCAEQNAGKTPEPAAEKTPAPAPAEEPKVVNKKLKKKKPAPEIVVPETPATEAPAAEEKAAE